MALLTFDEFKNTSDYSSFIEKNKSIGHLKVQAFTAYQAIPLQDVEVLITKQVNDNVIVFYKGITDSSGIINDIQLPAPVEKDGWGYDNVPEYELYDMTAVKQDFESLKKYNIAMFGGVRVLQYIKMTPEVKV